jgi:hypothetical protein
VRPHSLLETKTPVEELLLSAGVIRPMAPNQGSRYAGNPNALKRFGGWL